VQVIQSFHFLIFFISLKLSDVEKGGSTVFPLLNLKIPVTKGSAAFWYNLFPSGEIGEIFELSRNFNINLISFEDHQTLHSGCPVLIGTKWVANKWMHEHGQEWFRPCTKIRQDNSEPNFLMPFVPLFEKGELKI
jgi:hypothetical protein